MSGIGDFFRVLVALWRFGKALAPLFEHLPSVLPVAGDAMMLGGDQAILVSKTLKKDGGIPLNAQSIVDEISSTINVSSVAIHNAVATLNNAASTLNIIQIPLITPSTTEINLGLTKITVVTGLKIVQETPFFPLRDGLVATANQLDKVRQQLDDGHTRMNELSQSLGSAGANLEVVGTAMKDCGKVFKDAVGS